MSLTAKGCHEFFRGFIKLLDTLRSDKVHIFGTSLGGFLTQKFVDNTVDCPRIQSLILCNILADTAIFNHSDSRLGFLGYAGYYSSKTGMCNADVYANKGKAIRESVEFMSDKLEMFAIAANNNNCVFDDCAINEGVREELYPHIFYPHAKKAH
ncbi:Maspardin-like protein [Leptotrombidium deliense]|uniref:Maspardin-like protein n=1 Tax=Leptotrombidium deliense TaxID=299467 RepID=A0A443RUW2_9ACAR|nr:Maspardin-like protein [Leptotrombidium deliense]